MKKLLKSSCIPIIVVLFALISSASVPAAGALYFNAPCFVNNNTAKQSKYTNVFYLTERIINRPETCLVSAVFFNFYITEQTFTGIIEPGAVPQVNSASGLKNEAQGLSAAEASVITACIMLIIGAIAFIALNIKYRKQLEKLRKELDTANLKKPKEGARVSSWGIKEALPEERAITENEQNEHTENALSKKTEGKPQREKIGKTELLDMLTACKSYDIDEMDAAMRKINKYEYISDGELAAWLNESLKQGKYKAIKIKLTEILR